MKAFIESIASVVLGLTLGLLFCVLAGESPFLVLQVLYRGSFSSPYDFGMTLFYSVPLLFTGLSVAVAFRAGLFNVGAEGQLTWGAFAAAWCGLMFPGLSPSIALPLAGVAAFLAGGLWGGFAGVLKAYRGAHEVISTIMLNFIAAGITSYLVLYQFKDTQSQNPQTAAIGANFLLKQYAFFQGAPVSSSLILALLISLLVWLILEKTVFGFHVRAVGENDVAARTHGVQDQVIRVFTMFLAGGLAGLVGVSEVLGNSAAFKIGFSPGYGFIGIAVALLARGNPIAIIVSALLFGALHKGASDLDMETTKITRDLALVFQALVILSVSASGLWNILGLRIKTLFKERS